METGMLIDGWERQDALDMRVYRVFSTVTQGVICNRFWQNDKMFLVRRYKKDGSN